MPKLFKGIIPANANIEIEYGRDAKVKFSYPIKWTYKKAVIHRAFPTIYAFFILAFVKLISQIFWLIILPGILFLITASSLGIYSKADITITLIRISNTFFEHFDLMFNIFAVYFLFSLIFPFFLALNKKWMATLMPRFGYYSTVLLGKTKEMIFIYNDIEDNKCVIPSFKNVFLNYKATGDFSKYLKKIKIFAYDFKYHIRTRIGIFVKHKKKANDFVYYAVFEFTKTPIDGYLECEYY